MSTKKIDVYIIHHSHTDIGYTDLQENIMFNQVDYIRTVVKILKEAYTRNTHLKNFKWNCETYYCVEQFLVDATVDECNDFFDFVRKGNIGLSASYLNFTDLADKAILSKRIAEAQEIFKQENIFCKTAMNADINGISLGQLDAFIDNGIEFLFMNIHCHHGLFPLGLNQNAYFWRNAAGKELLVWNGEHYNLGNALGFIKEKNINFFTKIFFGDKSASLDHIDGIKYNLDSYMAQCARSNYPHDFIIASLSGLLTDNAPPNPEIISTIDTFNNKYGASYNVQMLTLAELYEKIKPRLNNVPEYQGDLTDWWAHGVASTPYTLKHFKEAQRLYHLCQKLDPNGKNRKAEFDRLAEDNMLLFAEHTWGHHAAISNPYDTMGQNLDIRKASFASKAHEASTKNLNYVLKARGDKRRSYDHDGRIKAISVNNYAAEQTVVFFIHVHEYGNIKVVDECTGKEMIAQISDHPGGIRVSFSDFFEASEEKFYSFTELPKEYFIADVRTIYFATARHKDVISDNDDQSYKMPYQLENDFFSITYEIGKGVTSFYNKVDKQEMLVNGEAQFFTPLYEKTEILRNIMEERGIMGRNIRGLHAKKYQAKLTNVKVIESGPIFKSVELIYELEGTILCNIVLKLHNTIPRLEFKFKIGKTLSTAVESIFLPLELNLPNTTRYFDKGDVYFRPGIDQIPGSCMEYYLLDNGIVYEGKQSSILIQLLDAPLVYMGELKHHAIQPCDNKAINNQRTMYSWLMNNIWETNFKMNLAGTSEFCYVLSLIKTVDIQKSFTLLKTVDPITFICD